MPRYFMEVFYKGTNYAGFQVQANANSIQAEVEKALKIFLKESISFTGSSRTDAGVHAMQNYFHFDYDPLHKHNPNWEKDVYHMNAILPADIVIRKITEVDAEAHCRFDAKRRVYEYSIYQSKNPFNADRCFFYPYKLNMSMLNEAAAVLKDFGDFTSFSKRNTQVKSFECEIYESEWIRKDGLIIYRVAANRFLRGMVKGLVGTMLKVGRGKISIDEFVRIIEAHDCSLADFSVESKGLCLISVIY